MEATAATAPCTPAALSSALQCGICLGLLTEPLTLAACGHSFCRFCLVQAQDAGGHACPVCRAPTTMVPETAAVNITLQNVCTHLYPAEYEARRAEVQRLQASRKPRVPLFCMNHMVYPSQTIALYLFEPRYHVMMQRLAHAPVGRRRFGYVFTYSPSAECMGVMVNVTHMEQQPNGSYVVHGACQSRFKVSRVWVEDGTAGLFQAEYAEVVDDDLCCMRVTGKLAHTFMATHRVAVALAAQGAETQCVSDAELLASVGAAGAAPLPDMSPPTPLELVSAAMLMGPPVPTTATPSCCVSPTVAAALLTEFSGSSCDGSVPAPCSGGDASPTAGCGAEGVAAPAAASVSLTDAQRRKVWRQFECSLGGWRNFLMCWICCQRMMSSLAPETRASLVSQYGPPPDLGSGITVDVVAQLSFWLCAVLPLRDDLADHLFHLTTVGERMWLLLQIMWGKYGLNGTIDKDDAAEYVHCGSNARHVHAAIVAAMPSVLSFKPSLPQHFVWPAAAGMPA